MNDNTNPTNYCLEQYSEVKDIKGRNDICRQVDEKHKASGRFIKAVQFDLVALFVNMTMDRA